MRMTRSAALALPLEIPIAGPAAAAEQGDRLADAISIEPDQIAWSAAPPSLPEGAETAILEGDLTRQEPHTFRLRLPDGYEIAPHSHPLREHITVLDGTLMMGMGETFERAAAEPLADGSFFVLPEGDRHYAWADGETVVQLHGTGPWEIDYVDPADDPRRDVSQ